MGGGESTLSSYPTHVGEKKIGGECQAGGDTVRQRVMKILEEHPLARESDEYLWLLYIRKYCPEHSHYIRFMPRELVLSLPKFMTILRRRQEIQNDLGLYPPGPRVLERRARRAGRPPRG